MIVNNIFPTPIASFEYKSLSEEQFNFIKNLEKVDNEGNRRSKDTYILNQECLSDLKSFIEICLHEYLMNIHCPITETGLRLTQSWINYTEPGGFHHIHCHDCSFVSGSYYINADPEYDKINFYNNKNKMIVFESSEWNLYNSDQWSFPVKTGEIVLFPSDLHHSVEKTTGKGTRMSLAFNSFPFGKIGNTDRLAGLFI